MHLVLIMTIGASILIGIAVWIWIQVRRSTVWLDRVGQGQLAKVSDGSLYYIDEGQGEPIVLLHGLGASSHIWNPLEQKMKRRYRLLIPDLMGFGRSSKDLHLHYGLDDQARRIVEWLDGLGIQRAR